jgi:hypothetical protein
MAYDPAKDVCIKEVPPFPEGEKSQISIGLFSYSGGGPKLRINRIVQRPNGETVFNRLGGMTRDEALEVVQAVQTLAEDPSFWKV